MYRCSSCRETRKFAPRYIYKRKDKSLLITPDEIADSDSEPVAICCPRCFKHNMRDLADQMVPKDIYADGLLI